MAAPALPGSGESFPAGISKDDTIKIFSGAIFKLKDNGGFLFASAPFIRDASAGFELVLSNSGGARANTANHPGSTTTLNSMR